MSLKTVLRPALAGVALAASLAVAAPVGASQADLDLLQSYVGQWEGRGAMQASGEEETVKCKLNVTTSAPNKVQFNGQCAIAGGAISLKGTLGYFSETNRFEATGTSNAIEHVVAVGKRRGSGIDFTMRPVDPDTNAELDVVVGISLSTNTITVKAKVTDPTSGASTTANVPLGRKS